MALFAVLAFVVAALLLWVKKAPKTAAILMFVAGSSLGGWIGSMVATAAGWATTLGGAIFGGVVGAVLVVVTGFVFIHDLWPKHKAAKRTSVAGFFLPVFAGLSGGAVSRLIGQVGDGAGRAVSGVTGQLFGSIKGWW